MRKKSLLFIFFALFLSFNLAAFDNLDLKWNAGFLGFGMNGHEERTPRFIYFDILNIGIEERSTGIGFEATPARYWNYFIYEDGKELSFTSWSFANLKLYWNVIDVGMFNEEVRLYLGPFASINYIFYNSQEDIFKWNEYVFTAGAHFGLAYFYSEGRFYNLLGAELGYRIVNGENAFYLNVKIDIGVYVLFFIASLAQK
ncbi:MAG: hypothetical protein FWD28_08100 [Treponema sp.]|nr:hypothetical protein [Treponema sp.]